MMGKKRIKIVFIILFMLIIAVAMAVAVSNMSYFDIKSVQFSHSGDVSGIPVQVQRQITGLTGRNLFSFNTHKLKENLEKCEGVSSAKIEKYYPSELRVYVEFEPYTVRFLTENSYYCTGEGKLSGKVSEVSEELFKLYSQLPVVQISDSYARFTAKWGMEEGFAQMVSLVGRIPPKALISDIEYVNNNSNRFGRLVMTIPTLNAELFIEDPITYDRLEEVLQQIDGEGWYDVHAYKLVKHRET